MEKTPARIFYFLLAVSFPIYAQNLYGLVNISSGRIIQARDTIVLSYPTGNVSIACEIFDKNQTAIGQSAVTWSVGGNLTVLDTPLVASRVYIDASAALYDEKGYLTANAFDSVRWINNRVFIRIKGKNSGVIPRIFFPAKERYICRKFDVSGREHSFLRPVSSIGLILFSDPGHAIKKTIVLNQ